MESENDVVTPDREVRISFEDFAVTDLSRIRQLNTGGGVAVD